MVARIDAVTVESTRAAGARADRRAAGRRSRRSVPASGLEGAATIAESLTPPGSLKSHASIAAMALFRTVSCTEPLPPIDGRAASCCARRRWPIFAAWADAARGEPRIPHALGADLAGRRSHPRGLPPAAAALRRGSCAPTRPIAFFLFRTEDNALVGGLTLANIRRGVAQAGSLGYWIGAPYVAARLHDRRGARADPVRVRRRCGCTGSRRPASRPMPPRSGSWKRPASGARAMRAPYLCINGIWQDHLLYARLQTDPRV